ncbi:MAG: hypothetical protein AABM31_10890 [Actinomycetota bacterium]
MQDPPGQQPTEEELRAALEEQMRQIRVEDVLLQTTATLINLAGRRLGLAGEPDEKDVEQARLAIDGARALAPMCPPEQEAPVKEALSQLQMAYVQETQGVEPAGEEPAEKPSPEDEERAKARAKLWTPPGA